MPGTVTITTPAGESFSAYEVKPDGTPKAGLVLIQEIFGVNQVMRDLATDFAAQGYHVLVPDLFWRQEPGVDITDKSEADWQKALSIFRRRSPICADSASERLAQSAIASAGAWR